MADFFQNSAITTLHKLRERPIEDIEQELTQFSRQRPGPAEAKAWSPDRRPVGPSA